MSVGENSEWESFLARPESGVTANGGWFSREAPPDIDDEQLEPPSTVEAATRWFAELDISLTVEPLGDEVFADVTDASGRRYGSYVIGTDADAVAAESVGRWVRQNTRNRGYDD